ncbi:MAG: squalene/phytoene synthase family protein [Elusimicrobia bacterium]|nr:squalene/phytoene synthase family protein [Elusimicrobiota bacterium]
MSVRRPEAGSNFRLGFLLLPRAKREALSAIYAYCRLIDDVVDSGELSRDEARRRLDFWREEIERLYAGRPGHDAARALLKPVSDYGLPKAEFLEMIRGCALDLEQARYETARDLEDYMRGVASSVGLLCVRVFGWSHTPAARMEEFAVTFGYAFQLTNILRDVGADLEIGRVYLPQADLREAGYSLERLLRRDGGPGFQAAMEAQYRRAKTYYARARSLVDFRDRPRLLPAEVMAHVYEGLLEEIKSRAFPVLFERTRLPAHRKLALVWKAWLYCHGL